VTWVRAERRSLLLPISVDSILLAGVLFAVAGHPSAALAPGSVSSEVAHPWNSSSGADLSVDPPSFWVRTGSNVTLQAVWSGESPLCHLTPLWYRWAVGTGNATGFLNVTTGPSTTFSADSFDSGVVNVRVRSEAVSACGVDETLVAQESGSNISIVVPLSLSGLELGPNPLFPGARATLTGTVEGGDPPYTLVVAWGDGNDSTFVVPEPGPFSVVQRFPPGEFDPAITAGDTVGDLTENHVAEILSVGIGLEVAIASARYVAEVGIPVEFTGIVQDAPSGAVTLFDCSNATVNSDVTGDNASDQTTFACTFVSPGTAEVLFGVYPPAPGGPSASVILYESVVPAPTVSAELVESVGEVGTTALVRVHLSGGVLPLSLAWNLSENGPGGVEVVSSDGGGLVAVALGAAGNYSVGLRANDSDGTVESNVSGPLTVESSLEASADVDSSLVPLGAEALVDGGALAGCPPFFWWAIPQYAPMNGSAGNGTLPVVGGFDWAGFYSREGNLSVIVGVIDGCGATWQSVFVTSLVPPPTILVTAGPGLPSPNETLAVNVSIQDGMPPFQLYVNASDGECWNRTTLSDGSFQWLFLARGNGSVNLSVSVKDPLGGADEVNLSVVLVRPSEPTPPSPVPAPPTSVPSSPSGNATAPSSSITVLLAIVALAAAGAAATILVLRRRRAREHRTVVPGPDPVAILRQIIEPADGAERFTVELLAEEAGVPLTLVRTTIDRLVSEGRVSSESGADGEEVLSWSSEAGQ